MELKDAISDCSDLHAVDGDLSGVLVAMHGDGQLGGVVVLLSAYLQVAALDEDVGRIEGPVVVGVCVGSKDEGAFDEDQVEDGGGVRVHEQVHPFRNPHSVAPSRRIFSAPSDCTGPQVDVSEEEASGGDSALILDEEVQSGVGVVPWPVRGRAGNFRGASRVDGARPLINADGHQSRVAWEATSSEGNEGAALHSAEPWRD
mmetsp:Transcript_43955/g.42540  ORF Transcript_43955/g.42540 Transcript_43955/m.42540 type:complete len:202 (-) Transcript_43955:411-1016(-)